jgi:hypothetical protein
MIEFILIDVLLISLGIILYIIARALPRVEEDSNAIEKKNFLDRFANSDIPEKLDATFNLFLLKFLKRIKILTLKFDNALSRQLKRIKSDEDEKKVAIDFKEIIEKKESDIQEEDKK